MSGDRDITGDLLGRLRRHYVKPGELMPGGVFLREVCHGPAGGSRCDAIYVGFTSTSGRLLVGHEVKASRSDWLRELAKTGKADPWADQCHAWWVVTLREVIKAGELPDGWGHMVPGNGTRMQVLVPALVHRDRQPSWVATRSVVQAMDTERAALITAARIKAHDQARDEIDKRVQDKLLAHRAQDNGEVHREWRRLIEEALGRRIIDGHGGQRGVATLDDLRRLAPLLTAERDLRQHALELARPYSAPLASALRMLGELQAAVEQLQTLARDQAQVS